MEVSGHFLKKRLLKISNFYMMVESNRVHHWSMTSYLVKFLIWKLRGINVKIRAFLAIVSETATSSP